MYDAVVVLGGGRNKDGMLTSLSQKRLDLGRDYLNNGRANKIVVMGGRYKSLTPDKGLHDVDGFTLRTEYLISQGVPPEKIVAVKGEECRDTIYEAFASRRVVRKNGWKHIVVSTSIHHKERALMIFRKIYDSDVEVDIVNNPCDDDLSISLEASLVKLVEPLLDFIVNNKCEPNSWDEWYIEQIDFYRKQQSLHSEFKNTAGNLSEAHATIWGE